MNQLSEIMRRTDWFLKNRFGLFIHFGLYSIPSRGEWVKSIEHMSDDDYDKYYDEFNPINYNPREWARIAKKSGMKYAVMTAKHHDGFCLFDSKYTDYCVTNTPYKKDMIKEYVEAFRAEGLRVGLYYSLLDWKHEDYPHYADGIHPHTNNEKYKDVQHNFDNYVSYFHNQVEELLTNYGKIDIIWFDFSYGEMVGEKWKATELVKMVRSYNKDIIINNRLEVSGHGMGSIATGNPSEYSGDFVSPEQLIPPEGITDINGHLLPWEACVTMNNNWGYCDNDKLFKSASVIIKKLVECVSKHGNMLLNIGPDATGNIPEQSIDILNEMGNWMNRYSKSIYDCGKSDIEKPEWGRYTQNGNKIYAHIYEWSVGPIALLGVDKSKIKKIRNLATGAEMQIVNSYFTSNYPDVAYINFGDNPINTYPLPDAIDTVVEIEVLEI
jgi:alpha-L-fucosidase